MKEKLKEISDSVGFLITKEGFVPKVKKELEEKIKEYNNIIVSVAQNGKLDEDTRVNFNAVGYKLTMARHAYNITNPRDTISLKPEIL